MTFTKSADKDEWWGYYWVHHDCSKSKGYTFMLEDGSHVPLACPGCGKQELPE